MLAKSQTCAVVGLDGFTVQVEVDISNGLPAFNVVGLPDTAVQEARERVRAALRNSGCDFPMRRITVNLAPADLKKGRPRLRPAHRRGNPAQLWPNRPAQRSRPFPGRTFSRRRPAPHQRRSSHGVGGPQPGL